MTIQKRTIVISDIHGCFDLFSELLSKCEYNTKTDQLILLGDYIDRGMQSKSVIDWIMQHPTVIALRGNHDDAFLHVLEHPLELSEFDQFVIENGGVETIFSYLGSNWFLDPNGNILKDEHFLLRYVDAKREIVNRYPEHIRWLQNLPYAHQDASRIYVHAGINPLISHWSKTSKEDLLWIRELFHRHGKLDQTDGKMVIFGHTPTSYLHKQRGLYDPWIQTDRIGIDGAAYRTGQMNALIFEGKALHVISTQAKRKRRG